MSDGGKGDSPRPLSIPKKQFDKQFDRTFKEAMKIAEEGAEKYKNALKKLSETDK